MEMLKQIIQAQRHAAMFSKSCMGCISVFTLIGIDGAANVKGLSLSCSAGTRVCDQVRLEQHHDSSSPKIRLPSGGRGKPV